MPGIWSTIYSPNGRGWPEIQQYRTMKCWIDTEAVNQADQLNGMEWKGYFGIGGEVYRTAAVPSGGRAPTWGEWKPGNPVGSSVMIRGMLKNGAWTYQFDDAPAGHQSSHSAFHAAD